MCVAYTQSNRFSCSSFYIYIKREKKCSTTKIVFDRSVYLVVLLLVRSIWWGLFMRGIESTPDDFPTIFTLHNLWISEKDKNHPTQWRKCVMRMTTGVGRQAYWLWMLEGVEGGGQRKILLFTTAIIDQRAFAIVICSVTACFRIYLGFIQTTNTTWMDCPPTQNFQQPHELLKSNITSYFMVCLLLICHWFIPAAVPIVQ